MTAVLPVPPAPAAPDPRSRAEPEPEPAPAREHTPRERGRPLGPVARIVGRRRPRPSLEAGNGRIGLTISRPLLGTAAAITPTVLRTRHARGPVGRDPARSARGRRRGERRILQESGPDPPRGPLQRVPGRGLGFPRRLVGGGPLGVVPPAGICTRARSSRAERRACRRNACGFRLGAASNLDVLVNGKPASGPRRARSTSC